MRVGMRMKQICIIFFKCQDQKPSMATATKENISFLKEVFNGRPLDYSKCHML